MPNLEDFRSKFVSDTTFYVYDDLRAWQKGKPGTIYRYDRLSEAIAKFRELPEDMTSALGISYLKKHEVDMVQTNRGEPFLVSDYLRVDFVKDIPEHEIYLETVIQELNLMWKSEHALFGRNLAGVLISIEEGEPDVSYLANKILQPKDIRYPHSAIQEFFNEGVGWQNYEEIVKAAQIIYGNTEEYRKPRITKLSVDYIEQSPYSGSIRHGSMDMSVAQYRLLLEKTLTKEKPEFQNQIDCIRNREIADTKQGRHHVGHEKARDGGQHER